MNKNNKHVLIKILFCLWLLPVMVFAQQKSIDDFLLFKHAVNLTEDGRWSDAAILFKDIAARNPDWPEPKNNLAIAQFKLGKIEQAQQAIEAAVISLPSFKVAQSNRKKLYDHAAAMAYYKAVGVSEKPENPELEILTEIKKAPVVKSSVVDNNSQAASTVFSDIRNSLSKWSEAWSDNNIEQYFSVYSNDFTPSGSAKDYTQWRMLRRYSAFFQIEIELIDFLIIDP